MGVSQIVGLVGSVSKLFGGKPDLRPQREDELYSMIANHEPFSLNAARILWWRHSNPGSKADAAENVIDWGKVQSNFPALAAQAMAAGPATDTTSAAPDVPPTGTYRPGAYAGAQASYQQAQNVVSSAVQQAGAALTDRAANAIDPNRGAVTIPTSVGTIVAFGVVFLLVMLIMRRR